MAATALRISSGSPLPGFVPTLRLFGTPATINRGTRLGPRYEQEILPVLSLAFDYAANGDDEAALADARDISSESRARALLESLGPIELACLEHVIVEPDCPADYVVDLDQDPDALCNFSAAAIPQLRAAGWRVTIDPSYPHTVVDPMATWVARLDDRNEEGWFDLHLGVEIEGRTVDLLPALLQLLERLPASAGIDRILRGRRDFFAVPLDDGALLPIPRERMRVVLEVLRDLHDSKGSRTNAGSLRLSELELDGLIRLERDGAPALVYQGSGVATWEAGRERIAADPPPVREPAILRASLRPYQREGVGWLQHLRRHDSGGILADDMGLGKTLQVITHIVLEKLSGMMVDPVLVVAPTSLLGNWKRELHRFAPHLQAAVIHGPSRDRSWSRPHDLDVMITSYPVLIRDVEPMQSLSFHLLVLDEAQAIKNPASHAHRAVSSLECKQRLALSGTPIENNLDELWALFDVTCPGLLGQRRVFQMRYGSGADAEVRDERLRALRHRIEPYLLRRTKEQVARELPAKTEVLVPVDLAGTQRDLYESIRLAGHARVRKAVRKKGITGSTVEILDALTKLRQVCCDPELVPLQAARTVTESAKRVAALNLIDEQLSRGHHVLLFSQFATMLGILSRELEIRGVDHEMLTGSTRDRQARVDAFQAGRSRVFLISLKAGGTGLNLTRADTVIHYDPWWNPAAHAQATDRAHRMGQTRPVFVYNLVTTGSVEERMLGLQQRKRALADALLGQATSASPKLSERDVADLFAPLNVSD